MYGDECKFGRRQGNLREGVGAVEPWRKAGEVLDTCASRTRSSSTTPARMADVGIKAARSSASARRVPDVMEERDPGSWSSSVKPKAARRRGQHQISPAMAATPTSTSSARRSPPRRSPRLVTRCSAAAPDPRGADLETTCKRVLLTRAKMMLQARTCPRQLCIHRQGDRQTGGSAGHHRRRCRRHETPRGLGDDVAATTTAVAEANDVGCHHPQHPEEFEAC